MAERKPLVIVNGTPQALQPGDTLPQSVLTPDEPPIAPTTMVVDSGTIAAGTVASLADKDGAMVQVTEGSGADPLTVRLTFAGVTAFNNVLLFGRYQGGSSHEIAVEVLNPVSTDYELIGTIAAMTEDGWLSFPVFDPGNHIDGSGNVVVRLRHVENGISSHNLYIDYAVLRNAEGASAGGVTSHPGLTGRGIADAHPISAITGLQSALDAKVDDSQLSAFGASLIDDADAATARATLGLGTAATSNVTTSKTDTTSGRLLKVGDFGLGDNPIPLTAAGSLNLNVDIPSGIYRTSEGGVPGAVNQGWGGDHYIVSRFGAQESVQMFVRANELAFRSRGVLGSPNPWTNVYHSGNTTPTGQSLINATDAAAARATLEVSRNTFDRIVEIAGMAPTLYLNAKEQDYRIYSPATGLTRKALTDIVTTTRASDGAIFDAKGQLTQLTSNAPRVTFDPETGVGEGLLVEESRTNLLTYSQEFDHANWSMSANNTITANAAVAPDGTTTADQFVVVASGAASRLQAATISAGSTVTVSMFVKRVNRDWVALGVRGSSFSHEVQCYYNISTAAVGTNYAVGSEVVFSSAAVTALTGGWCRLALTVATNTTTIARLSMRAATANGTDGGAAGDAYYLWGAQLEEGSFPTSYIPTTAAATRAADVIKIDGTAFSDFYRHEEFTAVSYFQSNSFAASPPFTVFCLNRDSSQDLICLELNPSADIGRVVRRKDGGGLSPTFAQAITEGITSLAMAMTDTETAVSSNGTSVVTGTAAEKPVSTDITQLFLNMRYEGYGYMNGTIKATVFFPRRLPDATIQQLSALVI